WREPGRRDSERTAPRRARRLLPTPLHFCESQEGPLPHVRDWNLPNLATSGRLPTKAETHTRRLTRPFVRQLDMRPLRLRTRRVLRPETQGHYKGCADAGAVRRGAPHLGQMPTHDRYLPATLTQVLDKFAKKAGPWIRDVQHRII